METVTIVINDPSIATSSNNGEEDSFKLALVDGTEASALSQAVASRTCYEEGSFYLTAGPNPSDTVVPLTAKLPKGLKLYLHVNQKNRRKPKQQEVTFVDGEVEVEVSKNDTPVPEANDANQTSAYAPIPKKDEEAGNSKDEPAQNQDEDPSEIDPQIRKGLISRFIAVMNMELYNPFKDLIGPSSSKQTQVLGSMFYFSQLSSDLANERTFLAWIRTMLAAVRTIFSYEKVQSDVTARDKSLVVAIMMTATMLLMAGFMGGQRYYSTRYLLLSRERKDTYNMISLSPFVLLGFAIAVVTSVATYASKWYG
ncbi:expressed unknown protein [Seminavis robusta]|uniref:DUF202 domain-containing protein n=1 Tax=Seminavis robusta TaxID=568900 RepID=A0A9N8ENE5_9STRA|nr:expressed unknown protein [Seminavis robusta]|eukprot:Sro1521_g279440.1 n/a (311) ;mRNA; r:2390-3322